MDSEFIVFLKKKNPVFLLSLSFTVIANGILQEGAEAIISFRKIYKMLSPWVF